MWTSNYNNDSYLDFHITWFDKQAFSIRHSQYAMENITNKTAASIQSVLYRLLAEIGEFDPSKTHITTDCTSTMIKATEFMISYKCACHRLNTSIEKAFSEVKRNVHVIAQLDEAVSAVVTNIQHKADIQRLLQVKIKSGGQTRAWRGLFEKYNRVCQNYDRLTEI